MVFELDVSGARLLKFMQLGPGMDVGHDVLQKVYNQCTKREASCAEHAPWRIREEFDKGFGFPDEATPEEREKRDTNSPDLGADLFRRDVKVVDDLCFCTH
jgi:hypothetical protein